MGDLNELVERLRSDAAQLIRMAQTVEFGKDLSVRVKSPDLLVASLVDAADAITTLIAERDGLAGHVEQLVELLEIIKEHWIDYDHVYSISVHEARAALSLDTKEGKL